MAFSENKREAYAHRLQSARTRLLCKNGFFGLLLMHMNFALDESIETACTDGEKTFFSPAFMDDLSDSELDFVLMHEVLHVVLRHCSRYGQRDKRLFNIACDIVVNSNVLYANDMQEKSIRLKKYGTSMHLAPNGKEGYLYTAEEVYAMLLSHGQKARAVEDGWDDHARWGTYGETSAVYEAWGKYFQDACTAIGERKQLSNGGLPMFAERLLEQMKAPQVDWRSVLNDFVQEDITDYSFSPPDKRFSDSPFLLPDYNERTDTVKNVWFFVDTSGSISLTELTLAYSEIKGAIEQFNGALRGKLAFFDASVKEPIYEFEDVDSLMKIKPVGGGGTSFYAVFKYVTKIVSDEQPSVIVILTDGQSAIPPEESARGIPVLWLLNDEKITPKWGKIARIKVENEGL